MKHSSPTSSLVPLAISCALLLAACGAYGVSYAMVSAESVESNNLESQIQTQNNAAAELVQAKTEIAQLSTQQGTVDQYFVSTSNIVPFLEQLQSIGTYLGADVQVASVSANPGTNTPYGNIALSLTINGSFNAIARTIGAIEYQPYNVTLTSLTLGTTPGSNSSTASSSPAWTAAAAFTVGAETGTPATTTTPETSTPLSATAIVTAPATSSPSVAASTTATSSEPSVKPLTAPQTAP